MKYLCTKCGLKSEIEKMKLNLENLIYEKKADFGCPQIMQLSAKIDINVNKCIKCKTKVSELNRTIDDIKGCHLSFYYYGEAHLIMNMCSYIIRGLQKKEMVYVSMDSGIFENLKGMLKRSGIKDNSVQFYPVEELIKLNSQEGLEALKHKVARFGQRALDDGYSGIRWIGQPSYAIKKTSKSDFLKFESALTHAVENSPVSILCIYDSYDFMNEGEIIDEDIIKDSLSTHTHLLSEFKIKEI